MPAMFLIGLSAPTASVESFGDLVGRSELLDRCPGAIADCLESNQFS
jgi:hypothetical protein